ncbi:MAG: iron-containing alcohol dehydrogenase [Deltaproteobacteria bacterium]
MSRVEFTTNAAAVLAEALADRSRVLLITNPSRRFEEQIRAALGDATIEVFDGARVHVPADVVRAAKERLDTFQPDAVVTLGGGAATGLGKMLKREASFFFVAVPTTYAGSEMTNIWGTTDGGNKQTGRDDVVRPDLVVYDPAFTATLPPKLTMQSLFNALAHPISALEAGSEDPDALRAIREIVDAATQLAESPRHAGARAEALRGASLAGAVLDAGQLGVHHKLAHFVGGRFDLDHSALHAVLLVGTVHRIRATQPELYERIRDAAGLVDLPAQLFDLLRRVGAPTSLRTLGVAWDDLQANLQDAPLPDALVFAHQGRRPLATTRYEVDGTSIDGDLREADTIVVGVHGRGVCADAIVRAIREIGGHEIAVLAPQATDNQWYGCGYREPYGEATAAAVARIEAALQHTQAVNPRARRVLFGFSQGACLALEAAARTEVPLDAVIAINGARIGPPEAYAESKREHEGTPAARPLSASEGTPSSDLAPLGPRARSVGRPAARPLSASEGTRVLVGVAEDDRWVATADVDATATWFCGVGADVTVLHAPGDAHEIDARQRIAAAELLTGRSIREGQSGFGNAHETEALPGAVPRRMNSPRHVRYGLYAEQINGTGFVADREHNLRTWTYRVRPTAQHTPFAPLDHTGVTADFATPPEPNLAGWGPVPAPKEARDFVDGLITFGGAGHPSLRRGFAVHLYAANRSMNHRAFSNADGDLLIVPQEGRLTLLTELGVLEAPPGHIAIVPRGIRFSVLVDGFARGYVAEVYGRHFELPPRGPVGANGLTDPRHFKAPTAWYEDRVDPGYRLANKFGGRLFEATQDYAPHDVVGWHGNYTPYVYDLLDFSPVSAARFDHPDPSIFTVLTCPLDEPGAHTLDFVFFPPRWDVSEGTFRPPFFHRNATTEINGIIKDPGGDRPPFYAGGVFVTPNMTPHGVRNRAVHRILSTDAEDEPRRTTEDSMWFQFESALPLQLTRWAASTRTRLDDWTDMWGTYRTFFNAGDPNRPGDV